MKNKWQKTKKRAVVYLMAGVLFIGPCAMEAQAKAPKVRVDESVYVNLDYYGSVEEVNIVKGCFLNGNTVITDYGNYNEVVNMSNRAEPVLEKGKVTWNLDGEEDSFYFQCKTQELNTELPWMLDVSYRLNGREYRGEELAGAKGLVSTIVEVTPNKKAPEYYKNNMILTLATMVDMADAYSLDAPGSQTQTLGTKKLVIFMAMPGEEGTFQIDIGTNSFESMGLFFLMIPATLSSLDRISDIREVKDKVRDSLDAMSDGADVILDNLSDMKGNLEETKKGLQAAKEAKKTFDGGEDSVKADVDAAIASLDNISTSLTLLSEQTAVEKADFAEAMEQVETMRQSIYEMDAYLEDMEDASKDLQKSLRDLRKTIESELDSSESKAENIAKQLEGVAASGDAGSALTGSLTGILLELAGDLGKASINPINDTSAMVHEVENLTQKASEVINEGYSLGGKMTQEYKDNVLVLLDETKLLLDSTNTSVLATRQALTSMRSLLDMTETSLDVSIDSSLNGMIGILDNGIGMAGGSEILRNAKDTMKNAVDDELDEIEEDTNLLNIDTSLEFPSFTSEKNGTPSSIQIVMRTQEITIQEDESLVDIEKEPEDIGLWGRIKAVFARMFGWLKN